MDNYRNSSKEKSFNFFLPIALILSMIPLIVRMAIVKIDVSTANIWESSTQTDLFSQKKAFYLMIFSIFLIIISVIFFKKIFSKKDKIVNYILISCGVFFLFTLLSAIFSKYKEVSFYGIFDRAEGLITIACYMVLFVYSIYTFKNTKDYKYIITPLLILVAINAFLGLFQFIGQDLIKTSLGTSIVFPSEYKIDGSKINLSNGNSIYGTLFNSNYVGSFASIVLPILFCLTIFEDEVMKKIMLFIGTLLSVWLLIGSDARSGVIGVFCATIFGVVVFWRLLIKKWKSFLIAFISILVLLLGASFASKGVLNRFTALTQDVSSLFTSTSDFDYKEHTPVKDIKHVDKGVQVILPNETLNITYGNDGFVFKNSKDEVIPFLKGDKIYSPTVQAFSNISFLFGKVDNKSVTSDILLLQVDGHPTFTFKLKTDNSIHLINANSKQFADIEFPKTFGFNGKEKLGSARGYIWSRSLPLLKDNFILGGGPDTFAFRFPQNDLIGKYYALGTPNQIVDKAHNLYLQIALNYGVVALIGFMAIMLIYLVDSFKLYAFKEKYEKSQILGAVNSFGVIGYLFAGMFNDSVVSVSPVFWIILGVGVSLNYMNRKACN
ncbi:polymerase [Clostridium gelidum]|uniref:Polymerase n=1 Tax=Clostridium gelidum TaxID=704125 RepID=A0ABM7TLU9_9CLOT|nr:O-antigen ligase family protein [Clostridium gelidum]BCZ49034.1 polymerase [Clostridium gelidum]